MQGQDPAKNEYSSAAGCLTRLYWMFAGNALLFFAFAYLAQKHPRFPSLLDAACLFVAASLVYVRYLDIRHYKGQTGEGEPATLRHWQRYSLVLSLGSLGVWLAIRLLAPVLVK